MSIQAFKYFFNCILLGRRSLSTSARRTNNLYDQSIPNLAVNKNTRVICQGFTGKTVGLSSYILATSLTIYIGHFPL